MTANQTQLEPIRHRTKTQAITAQLTELARRLGADARMPTIQQLCELLGVSVVTLNRALSELEAQNIILRKHGVGIFVSPRIGQRTVGLVYDRDIFAAGASPFCGLLVEAARQRATSSNEKFSFYLAMPSKEGLPVHDDLVEDLRAARLDGLVFVGENNPAAAQYLQRQDIPLVALSYTPTAPYRVSIDWSESVRLGVQALAAEGCARMALWIPVGAGLGRVDGAGSFPELDAFKAALKSHKLSFHPELVWRDEMLREDADASTLGTNQEQGFRAAHEIFGDKSTRNAAPDGILILDDMMTRGAIITLQQLGVRVGRDVKIATHLNKGSGVLAPFEANIARIQIDPQEIVNALFGMLETLMSGAKPRTNVVAIKPALLS
jgi:DNA-binding LacI/PurR family transcriptional regulator